MFQKIKIEIKKTDPAESGPFFILKRIDNKKIYKKEEK